MTTTPLYSSFSRRILAPIIAEELRARPGEWVLLFTGDGKSLTSRISHWRDGRVPTFNADPEGTDPDAGRFDFELISHGWGTGQTDVFGRFRLHVKPPRG